MRVHPFTLLLGGGALACLVVLGIVLSRSSPPGPVEASEELEPDAGSGALADGESHPGKRQPRVRGRSVPRFQVQPAAEPLSAPASTPAPSEPPEKTALRERTQKDGFVYKEAGTGIIYMVQNGTKFRVRSAEDLPSMGVNPSDMVEVPRGYVDFLREAPADGTLWKEHGDPTVFYYENGQKRFVDSPTTFQARGWNWQDVRTVPPGGLKERTAGAPITR